VAGEEHWTKRSRASGRFMDVKQGERKFKRHPPGKGGRS
jgi:hypothetical protein